MLMVNLTRDPKLCLMPTPKSGFKTMITIIFILKLTRPVTWVLPQINPESGFIMIITIFYH